jgi:heterodisulfide reductase subunit B
MMTEEKLALKLNHNLLLAASENGADMIATACPLCQMNLEAYQNRINKLYGQSFSIPIVYFTHLVGAALGLDEKTLGLDRLIIPAPRLTKTTEVASV